MEAYGFSPAKDLLGQLLELNMDVAARIERGQSVTAPGVPMGIRIRRSWCLRIASCRNVVYRLPGAGRCE